MVTCDGAGASHDLISYLDKLAAWTGHQLIYSSATWASGEGRDHQRHRACLADRRRSHGEVRERRAEDACADTSYAHRTCWVEEAHVSELTARLRAATLRATPNGLICTPCGDGVRPRRDANIRQGPGARCRRGEIFNGR